MWIGGRLEVKGRSEEGCEDFGGQHAGMAATVVTLYQDTKHPLPPSHTCTHPFDLSLTYTHTQYGNEEFLADLVAEACGE